MVAPGMRAERQELCGEENLIIPWLTGVKTTVTIFVVRFTKFFNLQNISWGVKGTV
jgi:hypothetical protein